MDFNSNQQPLYEVCPRCKKIVKSENLKLFKDPTNKVFFGLLTAPRKVCDVCIERHNFEIEQKEQALANFNKGN